jgi:Glycosyl transferase family 2
VSSPTNGRRPSVSVLISSFDYEQFVGEAIASALEQVGSAAEVIVVDDGSRDASPSVIAAFGADVQAIFKENAGQASALNVGFEASHGESVIFLDADDLLLPGAAAAVAHALSDPTVAKAHWSMPIVDGQGRRTGELQDARLAEGDLRRHVFEDGPLSEATTPSPPMSGNAYPRWLLERVMPIPEQLYRKGADEYLFGLAPAFGAIVRLPPQSLYRMHGENQHLKRSFENRLDFQERHHAQVASVVARACRGEGMAGDPDRWGRSAWWPRTGRAVRAIEAAVPAGESVAVIDEGLLGLEAELRGRPVIPFPESRGAFAGSPASDQEALAELGRLRSASVRYIALAWPAFWWLEAYPRLAAAIRAELCVVVEDSDLILFGPDGS